MTKNMELTENHNWEEKQHSSGILNLKINNYIITNPNQISNVLCNFTLQMSALNTQIRYAAPKSNFESIF